MQSLISNYDEQDIAAISLDVNSNSVWSISPPSLEKLITDLRNNATVKIRYAISISRISHDQPSDVVKVNRVYYLHGSDSARLELLSILNENYSNQRVHLPFLFPKFLKVREKHFYLHTLK